MIEIRDSLHALAKQTVGEEKGSGESISKTETSTTGTSETSGHNIGSTGGTLGAGIGLAVGGTLGALIGLCLGAPSTILIIGRIRKPRVYPKGKPLLIQRINPALFLLSNKTVMPWNWRKLQINILKE
ncbi:MAG: hypothetical protein R3E93_07345 [Thiothrix sp.]